MSQKEPIIFGKQKLVFNSAKNRYDDDETNEKINSFSNEDASSINRSDSSETGVSTIRNSGGSGGIDENKGENKVYRHKSFLGDFKKPKIHQIYEDNDSNDLLSEQIKYALKNMSIKYSNNNISKSASFNYYCDFLLNKNIYPEDNSFSFYPKSYTNNINNNITNNNKNNYALYYNNINQFCIFNNKINQCPFPLIAYNENSL